MIMQSAAALFRLALGVAVVATLAAVVVGTGASDASTKAMPMTVTSAPFSAPSRCVPTSNVHLFVSPEVPVAGSSFRVLAVTDKPLDAELVVESTSASSDGGSDTSARSNLRHGGPPYFWIAEIPSSREASYTARLVRRQCRGESVASRTVTPSPSQERAPTPANHELWPTTTAWSHDLENVYSAWIETLFDAPEESMPTWPALQDVLRDRKRNLLFDYLGAGEDSVDAPDIRPDCADLPYFLRAYFSFKLRLPFGVSECGRGTANTPPKCTTNIETNEQRPPTYDPKATASQNFGAFLRVTLATRAHSGSARIALDDENSDYYPVALTWESLRPGTIYADPYGHVFVLAKRLPQNAKRAGVLFAVDAQPDGTVARKRFWRGNFLYSDNPALGGPGWKRFRPLSRMGNKLVRWGDDAIRTNADYGDLSGQQARLSTVGFFDAMDDVLAPRPLDPEREAVEIVGALEEQVRTRVDSVDSGRQWLATGPAPAVMPSLEDLFETTGTWEDYSTPSRDLRLLVAMDFVTGFPDEVERRPQRFTMPAGKSATDVKSELGALLERELSSRTISYPRTDGSRFPLSLAAVLGRKVDLEVAYNPNDCAEFRWGAPPGSDERSTCVARASSAQQQRMDQLRIWFHERRRPPRR
ncbi:hypothetical protein AKJ09_05085 [Labilithrix luteola]|uniref:Uncharacterized protein n=2 Tax=Labilithrix luteola TaxID=1391654 RepID=A0A0K1PYG0_9BACT|nr:hypothetical protein AKJ09_05085 [Labilithrix luteola]